ncbi:MAG: ParM/StbA family protein [Chloroflexi bacterium]|nr:MAG: ParM/StbA family protein [Chloroflexota bacterium]
MKNIVKIGYDPGASAGKIARVLNGEMLKYLMPSSVGFSRGKKDGLTLAGVVRPQRAVRRPFHVVFEGMEYLVGPNVAKFTKPIDRLDFERFTDSPELRATLYAALYQIVNGGPKTVALAIALPVEIVQDKKEAVRVERAMKEWIMGEHVFSVDGVESVIEIVNVRCKIPQPVATWFDWGMDNSGQWVKGKEAQRAPTLVIDQGFHTLDVLVVEGGQISQRMSGGDTLGMSRAADYLIEAIKNEYDGLTLELYEANELVKAVVNGKKAQMYVNGRLTDITNKAKQALSSLETDVDQFLQRSIGKKGGMYNVLLTGGGALAMSGVLSRRFPGATVMYEPVMANARGLAKLAARPGFLD